MFEEFFCLKSCYNFPKESEKIREFERDYNNYFQSSTLKEPHIEETLESKISKLICEYYSDEKRLEIFSSALKDLYKDLENVNENEKINYINMNVIYYSLKYSIIKHDFSLSDNKIVLEFLVSGGQLLIEKALSSNNVKFLEVLMEAILILIKGPTGGEHLLLKILKKGSLIRNRQKLRFINEDVDQKVIFMPFYEILKSEVGIKIQSRKIMEEPIGRELIRIALKEGNINNELNFLLRLDKAHTLISLDELRENEDKFLDKNIYNMLIYKLENVVVENMTVGNMAVESENNNISNVNKETINNLQVPIQDNIKLPIQQINIKEVYNYDKKENFVLSNEELLRCPRKDQTSNIKTDYSSIETEKIISLKNEIKKLKDEKEEMFNKTQFLQERMKEYNKKNIDMLNELERVRAEIKSIQIENFKIKNSISNSKVENKIEDVKTVNSPLDSKVSTTSNSKFIDNNTTDSILNSTPKINNISVASNVDPVSSKLDIPPSDSKQTPKIKVSSFFNKTNNSLSRLGAKNTQTESKLKTSKTYKGLKWKKVTKNNSLIFSKINYEDFENLFSLSEFDQFELIKSDIKNEIKHEINESPLNQKKSNALNIALGRVKLSNNDLIDQILSKKLKNENLVEQFLLYFPTSEELENIIKNKNNKELGRAELLFCEISDSSLFYNCLSTLRFVYALENRDYMKLMEEKINVFNRLLESSELVRLFGSLLVLGNTLNSNSFNGNAEGFSINSLDLFKSNEFKGMIKRKVNLPRLIFEITGEEPGSKISIAESDISTDSIINEIEDITKFYNGSEIEGDLMEKYEKLKEKYKELVEMYKKVQNYFGENDDSFAIKLISFVKSLI